MKIAFDVESLRAYDRSCFSFAINNIWTSMEDYCDCLVFRALLLELIRVVVLVSNKYDEQNYHT